MTGAPLDLAAVILFLDRAFAGHEPADVLRELHLTAIRMTGESGRGRRVTLVLRLEGAPR